MSKKKINKPNALFEDSFNLFAIIALYPIDKAVRIKSHNISIALFIVLIIIWCVPVFFIGGVVSSILGLFSLLKTLIKNKIYGNKKD